ncbi:hypothetical protein DL93DRAFT_2082204 [Clavulina sp. PMI_390]|nr:hypothetical protein DL93DRAFT_2082204 [Clavulina sp. PMI_390]
MFVAQLSALNADPELSPPPQVWLELLDFPTFTKIWYCTSARAHLDPILQQPVLFMWALDHLHGLPHQMHLVRMGVPLIDRSEGLIIPNGNVLATSYTTPFTEDLFKNEAHNGRWGSGGTSPEELDERMRVFANYYSSHKPPHTNCTTGNSVPLSNIAREGRETTRSGFTTVLSRLDESGQRIVHKPLHICTRAQTWKGKLGGKGTSAKVEQFTEWASSRDYTLWDEISGRLVVHNRDWVTGKVSFTIYQL